jgi:hypothetical protein
VCVALAIAWIFASRVASVSATPKDIPSLSSMIKTDLRGKWDYWIRQTVALFGYGSIGVPQWTYTLWSLVLGSLMFGGFAFARRRRLAYTIVAIPLLCFAAGTLAEIYMMHVVPGGWMQGRYFLPAWIGAAILAAWALPDSLLAKRVSDRFNNAGVLCWAAIQLYCFWTALNVFRNSSAASQQPGDPRHWRPGIGLVTPWMVLLVGVVGTALIVRYYMRRTEELALAVAPASAAPAAHVNGSAPDAGLAADISGSGSGSGPGSGPGSSDEDRDEPAMSSR